MIKVIIAGGTGWAGSALSKAVHANSNMQLVAVVSRKNMGSDLAKLLNLNSTAAIPIYENVEEALNEQECDVLVEYTKPTIAKHNVLTALAKGVNVIVGTSGLSDADYAEIEAQALAKNRSVLAVGNFALSAVLLQKFSEMAAKYIPNYEIIDYAHQDKMDAPSGTARELSARLLKVQESTEFVSEDQLIGLKATRGARLNGVQVHAVRLPGFVIAVETIFGLNDEKLSIRHDAGSSAEPYVQGGLLAIEKVNTFIGLKRGLDSVMEF